jgi:peptide/nickel transport system substrate-binding protein
MMEGYIEMKRKLLAILLVLVMVLGLAACGTAKPSGDTGKTSGGTTESAKASGDTAKAAGPVEISVALGLLPNGLDPVSEDTNTTMSVCYHIYDKLVEIDQNYKFIPGVAKSWKEVDALTWTFEIDLSYKFQNGDALTMDDVVYSFERLKDIPKSADTAKLIDSVTYEGSTLTIKAKAPNTTTIPRAFYTAPIVNKAYIEAGGKDAVFLKPVGTGPYKVTEFTPGTSVTIETWDGYPFAKPQINKIKFTAIPENAARYIAVESGQLQYAGLVSGMELKLAKQASDLSVLTGSSTRYVGFGFNCEKAPFDNANVRRAIVSAIDRESIAQLNGGRPSVQSMLFAGFDLYADPQSMPKYDLEKAKAMLEAEGYNASNPLKFTILLWQPDPGIELIQSALKSIGVEMTLEQVEFSVFLTKEGPGEFQAVWTSAPNRGGIPLTDLDRYDYRFAGSRDITRYNNPDYDTIADQMRVSTNPEELKTLAKQAHEIIGQDVPMVGIYLTPIISVMDKGLTGVTVRGDMIQSFRNATYTG